jgi:hypothetical protein
MKLGLRAARGALVVSLLATVVAPFAAAPASATAPTEATTLVAPTEGETVGGNPTFTWEAVPGAVKYRVQVSANDLFTGTLAYNADTYNLHATPPAALPLGPLFWRVAATDGGTGVGPYVMGSFTRQWSEAPHLTVPAAEDILDYPDEPLLFRWDALPGAQKYNIQIDDDENFVGAATVSTPNTSYTQTAPQANAQQFFWRVQGVSGSVVSAWSEARSYIVQWPAKPVLVTPGSGATVTDVVLSWTPVAGAASYQLQVSANPDFTNNITLDQVVKGTHYSPPSTWANGSYFWRVRARDTKTVPNVGEWSSQIEVTPGTFLPAQFTRAWSDRPTLLAPNDADYSTVSVPTLRWTAVPHASHYEIWLGTDSNFTPLSYSNCYTNQTSFTPYDVSESFVGYTTPGLCNITQPKPAAGTIMYWKVRAIDDPRGVLGQFSDAFSFMYRHDAIPSLTAPADGATVAVPTLTWTPVSGIAKYKVTVTAGGNAVSGSPFTTWATSFTPSGLAAGTTYTWYVQTLDDQGRTGLIPSEGQRRTFLYQPVAGAGSVPVLATPAGGALSALMPSMTWSGVTDATSYQVWYGTVGSDVIHLLGETSQTAFTSPDLPLTPDQYFWFVKAFDTNDAVLAISFDETFEVDSLAPVTGLVPEKCTPEEVCAAAPETPRLEWTPAPYAGGYLVTIANDAEFTNKVRTYTTEYSSLTPRESLFDNVAGSAYYWFVRPCRSAELNLGCGAFDTVLDTASAFPKRSLPVELLTPADDATLPAGTTDKPGDITFTWADYKLTNDNAVPPSTQGAQTYRIQVFTDSNLTTKIDEQDVDQTTYTPWGKTYPEGPLYWRVGAVDGSNNQLTFSPTRLVTKATPHLVTTHPTAGSTLSGTPYFQWDAQAGAAGYTVEAYKNGDVNYSLANRVVSAATDLTAYTPTTALETGDYAWRVRRSDIDGLAGPWTNGGVFTLAAAAPTLVSPTGGTVLTGNDVVFTWTAVPGAAQYMFEASASSAFTTLLDSQKTVMTSWAPTKKYADGTIYWRVKALDGADTPHVTGISSSRTLVKDGTLPTVTAKTPATNAPVTGAVFTATFSEKVVDVSATTFTMRVTASGTPVPGTVTPSAGTQTTTATFTPTAPLVPGESYTLALSNGIHDVNGNPLVPFSWGLRTALTVDGTAPIVQQFWDRDTSASASGGGYLASRTSSTKVSYSFTGTSASILGRRAADGGYADVYVDGVKQPGPVTFYSSTTQHQQVVWSKTGLTNAKHTVELRVLGTKPASSSSYWVYPDAFRYGTTTLQETSTSVVQSFRTTSLAGAMGGSYLLGTHYAAGDTGAQPYLTLKFKGTGIQWRGIRGTGNGIARFYVDGVSYGDVDTYGSSASTSGVLMKAVSGLPSATHTVKIVLTGTKRAASSGYSVTVDSFVVS